MLFDKIVFFLSGLSAAIAVSTELPPTPDDLVILAHYDVADNLEVRPHSAVETGSDFNSTGSLVL
jgi:hypothetical protein